MFYGGMSNVPGAPGNLGVTDLVYRGEPVTFETLPYTGGGFEVQPLAQGIPAINDPRFPMDQQLFQHYVEERRLKNNPLLAPYGGSILKYLKDNPVRGV
jgi:hypothetical protein